MWALSVRMAVVCGALVLAAANLQPVQHLDDNADEVFECYARYMRDPHKPIVALVHWNYTNVTRYIAHFLTPLSIINLGSYDPETLRPYAEMDVFWILRQAIDRSYGPVVLLVAKLQDWMAYHLSLSYLPVVDQRKRYLFVDLTSRNAYMRPAIRALTTQRHLHNVALLNWRNGRVCMMFPHGNGACGDWEQSKALGPCQHLLTVDQLFPDPRPKRYGSCSLDIFVPPTPPGVIDPTSHSEQPLVAGYQVAMINIISSRLNITTVIKNSYLDVVYCTDSYPYHTDTLRWYVPVAGPRAPWKNVVLVFQAPLWAAVFAFCLLNAFAWWLTGIGAGCVHCVLGSLLTLLNGAVPLPRRTPLRFLVMSWTLCALVLIAAFQSQLLSILLMPVADEQPITSQEELLASDVPIDMDLLRDMFRISDTFKWHANKTQGSKKSPALAYYSLTTKYWARNYTDARGKPTLYAFKEPIKHVQQCFEYVRQYPIMYSVNWMVRQLVENSIVAKFMRDMDFSHYWTEGEQENEPLTMHHLDFAFLALLLGLALATLTFLVEVVVWRTQHGWWCVMCIRGRGCWHTGTTIIRN